MPCYVIISVNWKEMSIMEYKENKEMLFKEKFHTLDISTTTPDDLKNILEDGKVILSVTIYDDNKCRVRSYALIDGEIMVYAPYHVLEMNIDTFKSETLKIENLKEWREKFKAENTYIGIDDELYETYGDNKQELLNDFSKENNFIYISNDKANFYGPLECFFIELWLSFNKDYYI